MTLDQASEKGYSARKRHRHGPGHASYHEGEHQYGEMDLNEDSEIKEELEET